MSNRPRINWLATASIVVGVVGLGYAIMMGTFSPVFFLLSVPGLVLGLVGLRHAKRPEVTGRVLARLGITLSALPFIVPFLNPDNY